MRAGWVALVAAAMVGGWPAAAAGQDGPWRAEVSVGWVWVVDDATDNYFSIGGSVRRLLTPRLSIGPEVIVMNNRSLIREQLVMVTGNVVYDLAEPGRGRVTPFVVGGLGVFAGREVFPRGSFWGRDPTFTAGVGLRGHVSDSVRVGAEYRVGGELHQRLNGTIGVDW